MAFLFTGNAVPFPFQLLYISDNFRYWANITDASSFRKAHQVYWTWVSSPLPVWLQVKVANGSV